MKRTDSHCHSDATATTSPTVKCTLNKVVVKLKNVHHNHISIQEKKNNCFFVKPKSGISTYQVFATVHCGNVNWITLFTYKTDRQKKRWTVLPLPSPPCSTCLCSWPHLPSELQLSYFISVCTFLSPEYVYVFGVTLEVTPSSSSLCVIPVSGCANALKLRLKSSYSWRMSWGRRSSSWQTFAWRRLAPPTTWIRSEKPWTACRWGFAHQLNKGHHWPGHLYMFDTG